MYSLLRRTASCTGRLRRTPPLSRRGRVPTDRDVACGWRPCPRVGLTFRANRGILRKHFHTGDHVKKIIVGKNSKYRSYPCLECMRGSEPGKVIFTRFMPFAETGHQHIVLHASCMRKLVDGAPLDATVEAQKKELERRRQLIETTGDPYAQ